MLSALLVVLAAAPADVLVVLPTSARDAALKAAPGRSFIDASALYEHLLAPRGVFDFQDFKAFSEGPIEGWPSELDAVWKDGVSYCAEIAGPVPWRQTLPGSRCCGRRLGLYLWARALAALKANEAYVVWASTRKDTVIVRGTRSTAVELEEWVVEQQGPPGSEAKLVAEVFSKLLAKEGSRVKRTAVPRLFVAEPGDPWAQAATTAAPLELKTRCDQLPARLSFKASTPTAQALQARWAAAARGTGPALECTLQFSSHDELPDSLMPFPIPVVTSVLRCGDVTVTHELARNGLVKTPLDAVTAGLAQSLAARLCR